LSWWWWQGGGRVDFVVGSISSSGRRSVCLLAHFGSYNLWSSQTEATWSHCYLRLERPLLALVLGSPWALLLPGWYSAN
jgi:hypothetical protein